MKKMMAVLGVAALVFSSGSLAACGMDKHDGEAKGSVTEKQGWAKTDKAGKASKKAAKKEQAAKQDKTRAKL